MVKYLEYCSEFNSNISPFLILSFFYSIPLSSQISPPSLLHIYNMASLLCVHSVSHSSLYLLWCDVTRAGPGFSQNLSPRLGLYIYILSHNYSNTVVSTFPGIQVSSLCVHRYLAAILPPNIVCIKRI